MAIETLHFVSRRGHVFYERSDAVGALVRLAVPRQRRSSAIKVGQVCHPGLGVVRVVVHPSEVVGGARSDFDAGRACE